MLIMTAKLPRRKLAFSVAAAALVCCAALALNLGGGAFQAASASASGLPSPKGVKSNEDRVAYLQSLGWEVEPEPVETLQFLLPEKLEEPYLTYNELQAEQGFDLSACCGKQVSRYTYTVTNYPGRAEGVQVNLYVCEEMPVAGDILCAGADGFQDTLAFPEAP